jgi:hypothetical protein
MRRQGAFVASITRIPGATAPAATKMNTAHE